MHPTKFICENAIRLAKFYEDSTLLHHLAMLIFYFCTSYLFTKITLHTQRQRHTYTHSLPNQ